jgi:cholesterol 25-hydroxylase
MHKSPWLYRTLHKKHHTNTSATRANDTVRLTMGEEVLDVGCSIVAVNALGAHPLSRAVYDVVIVWLLVELHCGYDFPWASYNVVPNGVSRLNSSPLRNTPMIRLTLLARLANPTCY